MPKTLTLRIDDETYQLLKKAAEGSRRAISNYIEFAAIEYTMENIFVSDEEMDEISDILPGIEKGLKDYEEGRFTVIG